MLPEKFIERMRAELGDEFDLFIKEYEKPPVRGFRVNTLKASPEQSRLFPFATGKVDWCEAGFYYDIHAGKLPVSRAGLIYSQEPSAQLPAEMLKPEPSERVLDLCAAPGGKSTQIAAAMQGKGLLVANEINPSRAAILAENLERAGAANAVVTNMSSDRLETEFVEFFDKILVDAPCSGEGMFRRDETAIAEWSLEHTLSCANRQLNILRSAVKMLRGGGELVYSTCTFSRTENEDVVEKLTAEFPELRLLESRRIMPHTHKGEGQFAARLVKTAGEKQSRRPFTGKADTTQYRRFEAESLNVRLEGNFAAFGERLFLVPAELGSLDKLKTVRAGLYLGDNKKGRFEPAHSLCMALKKDDFRRSVEIDDAGVDTYYRGEALNIETEKGFCAVLWHGFPIGWGKASDGVIKNRIPKYLRG